MSDGQWVTFCDAFGFDDLKNDPAMATNNDRVLLRPTLLHGHVVDFIQWYWRDHYWPAFNVADAAIVGGAVGIALFGLLGGGKDRARTGSQG